jgi:preprotein translocase subunit Sss1
MSGNSKTEAALAKAVEMTVACGIIGTLGFILYMLMTA